MEKIHYTIVKFEVENLSINAAKLEAENLELLKIEVDKFEHLHNIGAHIYSNLACTHFSCKKSIALGGWMDG